MRILVILENYYPRIGGVETFFKTLVERLGDQGHHVTVLTNRYDANLKALEHVSDHVTIIRKRFYNRYIFTFLAGWTALKFARQADLIHTTSYNAAIPAWIAAKLSNTKSIITFHERWGDLWNRLPWMPYPVKWLHRTFESMILKLGFDRFVAVSEFTKHSLINGGVSPDRVVRIYNGINYKGFPRFRGSQEGKPFTFLFFGRVGYAKGLDILIHAYQLLLKRRTDHHLIFVLPSEHTSLFNRVERLLKEQVPDTHFTMLHDLPYSVLLEQIAGVDAIVIPSYSEGFCFAAVETMAIGTPIISSGQGALKEVISGKHLTMKSHTPLGLSEVMNEAIDGKWNESVTRRFQLQDTIDKYLKLYQDLLPDKIEG